MDNPENPTAKANKASKKKNAFMDEILKYYLVPVLMLVVSIFLVFFVLFPQLEGITNKLNDINKLRDEYSQLQIQRQNRLSLQTQSDDQITVLEKIDRLIPQSQTQVVGFSEKIREKGNQSRVSIKESLGGENVNQSTDTTTDSDGEALELVELPAEFSVAGRLDDIKNFLVSLYGGDDFIIIKSMDLQRQANTGGDAQEGRFSSTGADNWLMNLVLVKYQFRVSSESTPEDLNLTYFTIPESAKADNDVLEFIDTNYK